MALLTPPELPKITHISRTFLNVVPDTQARIHNTGTGRVETEGIPASGTVELGDVTSVLSTPKNRGGKQGKARGFVVYQ